MDNVEISSHISKKRTFDKNTNTVSCEVKEVTEILEQVSTPKSLVKKSSSMECNYTLSKLNVAKYGEQSRPKVIPKKVKRFVANSIEIIFSSLVNLVKVVRKFPHENTNF